MYVFVCIIRRVGVCICVYTKEGGGMYLSILRREGVCICMNTKKRWCMYLCQY